MIEILTMCKNFINFAAVYWFHNCIRAMMAGTVMLLVILLIRGCNRKQRANINIYAMLLLLPMAFMGMNKLFFTGKIFYLSNFLNRYVRPPYGTIYFAVMGVLFLAYVWKSICLRNSLKKLPFFCCDWQGALIDRLTAADGTDLAKRYLKKVKIYVTPEPISPFSGGVIRPFVVIPEEIAARWDEESCQVVLGHELLHIKSGHILILFFFAMLRIYWWINPTVYLCEKVLREDLEMACDESCIKYTGVERAEYGKMLLSMITMLRGVREEGIASFLNRNYFQVLRRRIGYLSHKASERNNRNKHWEVGVFAVLFAAVVIAVALTSYPRFTKLPELTIYNEELEMVMMDAREDTDSLEIRDGKLIIDKEGFRAFLKEQDYTEEYIYISFDTIMKVPGTGGGGNVAMVNTADLDDVFYLSKDCVENKVMVFLLKYFI
ncbi:MAG: M56 family metallopeptidase [Lachnospiraceae bacterium]|nr:M56 family metallopeptidase [Lachnospiraceae bacterium]